MFRLLGQSVLPDVLGSGNRKLTKFISQVNATPALRHFKSEQRIYGWGFAGAGALGLPDLNQKALSGNVNVAHPYNMMYFKENNLKISAIAGGCGYSIFSISKPKNKLVGTGINTDSQIGFHLLPGDKIADYICRPVDIDLSLVIGSDSKIVDVAAGRAHSIILTEDKKVYAFGNNAYGQCGRPVIYDEKYSGSRVIHEINVGEPVKRVIAGQDHSVLLTDAGRVFTFGISTDGQLGRPCSRGFDSTPGPVGGALSGIKIKDVSCRSDTVLAVSEDGVLYGWGNNEYSQLFPLSHSETQLFEPNVMSVNKFGKIISCAASSTACIAVGESGNVYSWGYGPLGRGPTLEYDYEPKEIPSTLFGRNELNLHAKPTRAYSGMGNFFITTSSGDLYSWGRNNFGTCGLGLKEKNQYFPLKTAVRLHHNPCVASYRKASSLPPEVPKLSAFAKIVACSPKAIQPYLQLMRIDRPIGIYLLFLPTCWGTALAANPGVLPNFQLMSYFFIGALLMRSAGCVVNDIWDQGFDRQVERTKNRPIAAGVINPYTGLFFAGSLSLSAAVIVLLPLNLEAQIASLCSIPLVLSYPAAKRFIGWPQLVLGFTFNWGVMVGYVAASAQPVVESSLANLASVASLYASGICWTLWYDTIYAYQDYDDDKKVGVRSTAITWGRGASGRRYLGFFGSTFIGSLSAALLLNDVQPWIASAGVASAVAHLVWQMRVSVTGRVSLLACGFDHVICVTQGI